MKKKKKERKKGPRQTAEKVVKIKTIGNYDLELIALKIKENLTHTTYSTNKSDLNTETQFLLQRINIKSLTK